jgi:16S rRNA (cytosine1402-N4)-methyltransferase
MNYQKGLTASDVVNSYSLQELCRILNDYGELPNAYNIAKVIESKQEEGLFTTAELIEALTKSGCVPRGKENKFFAKVFQALRIEVNQELLCLRNMLEQCAKVMVTDARLVVMSYHSLEDRLVKNYIKTGNCDGVVSKDFYGNVISPFEVLTRKPIMATEEEMEMNPRSRSAKLRIAKMK